jgi:hypothetical protein
MNLFSKLFPQKVSPTAAQVFQSSVTERETPITRSKWITCNGKIGIANNVNGWPMIEIHYTDPEGVTILVDHVHASSCAIARYNEIPAARRPENAAYAAAVLGYV